jgi:hypothetical protein
VAEPLRSTLADQQLQLARHLRDPEHHPPPPGIETRRLAIYRDLFFNNVEGLLAGGFPVIVQTLEASRWRALVREFYATYCSHTPLFAEVAREFVRFLQERDAPRDPGWLPELAHYEWVELALETADSELPAHDPSANLLDSVPVVSPTAWALAYRWPVQRIGPAFQPDAPDPEPTLLLVRRDAAHQVRFAEISPLVYRLLQLLGESTRSGRDALLLLAEEAQAPDPAGFMAAGSAMLERLRNEDTLLGGRVLQ